MAPWDLEELQNCREYAFPSLKANIVESLYTKIGGVPRYVLEIAANARKDNIEEAFQRIQETINNTNDVSKLLEYFTIGKHQKHSSRLLHCWPLPDNP